MRAFSAFRSCLSPRLRGAPAVLAAFAVLADSPQLALAAPGAASAAQPVARDTLPELISEASRRFGVPASWIAEIMAVESRGHAGALSPKGAIGLMQVMPSTYADMRARFGLGANPWNPRDNVLAGTAYLRLLLDRYGAPGFLVAYNAGPGRWDDYRLRARPLPAETVAYLTRLGPVVGGSALPMQSVAARRPPRLPRTSPVFVQLASIAAPVQDTAERERIARIVDADASVVGRADAMFVPRPSAAEAPSRAQSEGRRVAGAELSSSTAQSTSSPDELPRNPLFPERASTGPRR